jgi:hypothetical protein
MYKDTFFKAHDKILFNVYNKIDKLIQYSNITYNSEVDAVEARVLFLKSLTRK